MRRHGGSPGGGGCGRRAGCEAVAGTIIKSTHQSGRDLMARLLSCILKSFWVELSALFVSEGDANDVHVLPAFTDNHPRPGEIKVLTCSGYYRLFFKYLNKLFYLLPVKREKIAVV